MLFNAAELAGISSAVLFALGLVFLKKGYRHSTPFTGTIIITAINTVLLWVIALSFSSVRLLSSSAVLLFIIGGVIGHGIARYLQFIGVDKIGPARNTTVLATSALFGSAIAVIFLGERWTVATFIGTIAIVIGVMVLANERGKIKWKRKYLAYPLIAAFLYGVMSNIYKIGLVKIPDALLAAAVGLTSALVTFLVIMAAKDKKTLFPNLSKALPFFIVAGIVNSIGLILNFQALKLGDVSVVFPLISTQPLFAVFFGYLFLKQTEKISPHVIIGALSVVAGIAAITAF